MNVAQGGLPSWSDHERAISRPVAEDRETRSSQVFRLRAGVRGPALGEARSAYLPRGLQASQCRTTILYHGRGQTRN